jgi:hypothetical protein
LRTTIFLVSSRFSVLAQMRARVGVQVGLEWRGENAALLGSPIARECSLRIGHGSQNDRIRHLESGHWLRAVTGFIADHVKFGVLGQGLAEWPSTKAVFNLNGFSIAEQA